MSYWKALMALGIAMFCFGGCTLIHDQALRDWSEQTNLHLRDLPDGSALDFDSEHYADYSSPGWTIAHNTSNTKEKPVVASGWPVAYLEIGKGYSLEGVPLEGVSLSNAAWYWIPPNLPSAIKVDGGYLGRREIGGRKMDFFFVSVERWPPIWTFELWATHNDVEARLAARDCVSHVWTYGPSYIPKEWMGTVHTPDDDYVDYDLHEITGGYEVSLKKGAFSWRIMVGPTIGNAHQTSH